MKYKKLPSLQFVITDQIRLLSPLNSNDRSIPLCWLNNVVGVYLVKVSLLLISRVWDISSCIDPCFPLAGGLCKFYANPGGKLPIQRQLLLVQYKQEANPLLLHNYTPLVIGKNDKNKQLTIIKPM